MTVQRRSATTGNHRLAELAKNASALALSVVAFIPFVATLLFVAFVVIVLCIRNTPRPDYEQFIRS
jgi:hypothetical protein